MKRRWQSFCLEDYFKNFKNHPKALCFFTTTSDEKHLGPGCCPHISGDFTEHISRRLERDAVALFRGLPKWEIHS